VWSHRKRMTYITDGTDERNRGRQDSFLQERSIARRDSPLGVSAKAAAVAIAEVPARRSGPSPLLLRPPPRSPAISWSSDTTTSASPRVPCREPLGELSPSADLPDASGCRMLSDRSDKTYALSLTSSQIWPVTIGSSLSAWMSAHCRQRAMRTRSTPSAGRSTTVDTKARISCAR
jgi:hypothetical protein